MSSGVLLVGHGTRDATGTDQFFELTAQLQQCLPQWPVEGCLLEFQQPDIASGWQRLVDRGVTEIRVAPLLLFAAGHARQDIPTIIQECSLRNPDIRHWQCGPLSRAPEMVDLLVQRIEQAASGAEQAASGAEQEASGAEWALDDSVSLVMVGRGSYDPCAQADMKVLTEVVANRLPIGQHAVSFYAMAEPKLPAVLDQVASQTDRPSTVIVQPHLLFQGRLYDAIAGQVSQAASRHPEVRFICGDYLGPTESVAKAVQRRLQRT